MDNEIKIGKSANYSKNFTEENVKIFANISDDNNPIHIDENYAAKSFFKKRIVHGLYVSSMFSTIFGTIYPGRGSIYLSQLCNFIKPVYFNEEITATVTLIKYDSEKNIGIFTTECKNNKKELVISGEAKILFPKKQ